MIFIGVEEMIEHGSGVARGNAFAVNNMDGCVFRWGAVADDFFAVIPLPSTWQGETIDVEILLHHRTGGLSGGGADDVVRMEFGYELNTDGSAVVDLGPNNNGTAPNEANQEPQLGTTIDAPKLVSLTGGSGIVVGASDVFLWIRVTRNANHANDNLSGNILSTGAIVRKIS